LHLSLVTFPGEQDCVPIDRHAQRMGDCLPAIGDSYEIVAFAPASVTKAAGDLCDDGIAVLGVRIVVGDDCIVSAFCGDPPHREAPVLIPLAYAAEHRDDATGRSIAEECQHALQSVRRMGKVDEDRKLMPLLDELHTPGRSLPGLERNAGHVALYLPRMVDGVRG